jgi:tRNA pseudouridine32 synthase/23S rRNA pseudouridine746 synthase
MPGIEVLHLDSEILVLNKPAGLLSVPGRGPDKQECAVSRAREMFADLPEQPAVHRLDMDTSGLLILARTREAHRFLSREFAARRVCKRYEAILAGRIAGREGMIELPLRLDLYDRPRQVYDPIHGKPASTRWRKLAERDGRTRIEFFPLTGRTHQLRVHAAHPLGLGCPIVGDRLYGNRAPGERMLLHAAELCFKHLTSGQYFSVSSPAPFQL